MRSGRIVLVKHAKPILDPTQPAREWKLGPEGEAQSQRLAERLRSFLPCGLLSSPEPKASRTCEIAAAELGLPMKAVTEFREIDRRLLPIMSSAEHEALNGRIFAESEQRILGCESAREATERFTTAMLRELERTEEENLVVIAHGTVISLFVSAYNSVDPFELWRRLHCPSFVVVKRPSLALVEVIDGLEITDLKP
jgi:2,3-bisphosphoglycerate-dependent phosphoglycerate mutase